MPFPPLGSFRYPQTGAAGVGPGQTGSVTSSAERGLAVAFAVGATLISFGRR